jgi:hypothetical protein
MQLDKEWTKDIVSVRERGWGVSPWGDPWGDEYAGKKHALRSIVPRNQQLGRSLAIFFEHRNAHEEVHLLSLAIDFRTTSTRNQK